VTKLRILFVAMSDSIHTARWINQLNGQGWDMHLFPSIDYRGAHSEFRNITVHHSLYGKQKDRDRSVKLRGVPVVSEGIAYLGRTALNRICPDYRAFQLRTLIKKLHPDIIHSIEIQAAGYLTLYVKKRYAGQFPPWIVTNWGNDIYLFGRLSEHVDRIKEVLASCDYYSCECQRDVQLAKLMGFRGEVLPVLPNTGGYDLTRAEQLRQPGPTSARRLILLKGYQDWHGRALVGLRAIALCADALKGYRVGIYVANSDVKIAAELISKSTGIPIDVIPRCSHDDMLRLFGRARVYIGLSISDGISISSLEAIVMGAFPIQSCTACADEWIVDRESGLIVPPEDPEPVAAAIRRAISEDALVDHASEVNARVARERLDQEIIKPQVIAIYQKIAGAAKNKKR
jgi:glycosyltransferase involved in cell wall biosynthesis